MRHGALNIWAAAAFAWRGQPRTAAAAAVVWRCDTQCGWPSEHGRHDSAGRSKRREHPWPSWVSWSLFPLPPLMFPLFFLIISLLSAITGGDTSPTGVLFGQRNDISSRINQVLYETTHLERFVLSCSLRSQNTMVKKSARLRGRRGRCALFYFLRVVPCWQH